MSKLSLKGNPSGTGNFTIEAPNSNVDRTFALPDEAGTVLTTATDLEPQVKDSLNATGSAPVYACRAWVNFDGTGTVSIRGSGNVSSITDNATGDYTVNFTTNMPDDLGACVTDASNGAGDFNRVGTGVFSGNNKTVITCFNTSQNAKSDVAQILHAVFR